MMLFSQKIRQWEDRLLLAVTVGLTLTWVLEPTLPEGSWMWRLWLAVGCLTASGAIFCRDALRQYRHTVRTRSNEREAHQFLEALSSLEPQELIDAEPGRLPAMHDDNPWLPVCSRLRDGWQHSATRAEDAEHLWTSAEVRLRRLTAEHQQIEQIVDGLTDPVIAINQYDELAWANRRALEMFGIEHDPQAPLPVSEQLDVPPLVELLTDTRRRKSTAGRTIELEIADADGSSNWYRAGCRALPGDDEHSDDHGAVVVLTDIGNEHGIRKRHAAFVSAASHEMKTPLAGIRAYVELLLDNEAEDAETREEFLGVIDTQADRLQRLIENLLNLARIEAGVERVDKQHNSLNELLEHALEVVQPSAEQKQIKLTADLSPMYMGVFVDRDMIVQAAINLLSNAIKYTDAGGQVTLRSRMEDKASVLEVADTGVGLSPEDCELVFEKFYRVKENKNMAPGTGLGLPLAKHIVDDVHGGSLTVSSQKGEGSVFRISLPSHSRQPT